MIVSWTTEVRSKEVPQCVHVRDAFAAGWSASTMRASFLSQCLQCMIAGESGQGQAGVGGRQAGAGRGAGGRGRGM